MGEIPLIFKAVVLTLYGADIAVLAVRFRRCNARGELLLFSCLLLSLALRCVVPAGSLGEALLSLLTLWISGLFMIRISGSRKRPGWTAACLFFSMVTALSFITGAHPAARELFRAYSLAILGVFPVVLLHGLWRESRSRVDAIFLIATVLLLADEEAGAVCGIFGLSLPDAGPILSAVVAVAAAYSIFQDGYLLSSGWRGWEVRRSGHEKLMRAANRRILRTENALVLQDRLVVSGLLVMGAAHDFKNSLAQIRTTADFALGTQDAARREAALRLIGEHADAGAGAAVSFLERFSRAGREESTPHELADRIGAFLSKARAAFRADGVVFEADLRPVRVRVRWSEIEQVLLNLAGNSVEGYRRLGVGNGCIRISCRPLSNAAFVEVSDKAGGMKADTAARLFQVSPAAEGGTGLGLYLSRSLLDRNGGTLSYAAVPGGSCFRLTLPLA